jgi:phospholipid transport system substrate-binding protein
MKAIRGFFRLALVLFASAGIGAAHAPASAQDGEAAVFIIELGDSALQMLANSELTDEERTDEFRRILLKGFDLPLIGRYALGRHWRRATEGERDEFNSLFESFIVESYATRLGRYGGETFKVTGERNGGGRDSVVRSEIQIPAGPRVRVDWRVRSRKGTLKVVDVVVEGVSMLITQRDEFSSVIQRSGGQVEGLLASLRQRVR